MINFIEYILKKKVNFQLLYYNRQLLNDQSGQPTTLNDQKCNTIVQHTQHILINKANISFVNMTEYS